MKKTSEQWLKECPGNIRIFDYDGWDRSNLAYSFSQEKISKKEFIKRLIHSTTGTISKEAQKWLKLNFQQKNL